MGRPNLPYFGAEGDKMTTRHLVDPQLLPLLDYAVPLAITAETLGAAREAIAAMFVPPSAEVLERVTREEVLIPGWGGAPDVRALFYSPRYERVCPAVLHIHGGGMIMGAPEMNEQRNATLASELGVVVCSVNYRLAPETAAPGGVEDCYTALAWLHSNAVSLGIDPHRIAVLGESAGGGLAAALALLARDRKEFGICLQVLIYPMLDDRTGLPPRGESTFGEFIWTPELNIFGWSALLGEYPGGSGVSAYAAPARATELAGLPATYIAVGALDLFCGECIAFADKLVSARVQTELHLYPGAVHGFDLIADADVSKAFTLSYRAALAKSFDIIVSDVRLADADS